MKSIKLTQKEIHICNLFLNGYFNTKSLSYKSGYPITTINWFFNKCYKHYQINSKEQLFRILIQQKHKNLHKKFKKLLSESIEIIAL